MTRSDVNGLLEDALLGSILCAPDEPGLTSEELIELGTRLGLYAGELQDAIGHLHHSSAGRYVPDRHRVEIDLLWWSEPDDLRSIKAFDFFYNETALLVRQVGRAGAQIPLETLLSRATVERLPERDVRVAIAIHELAGKVTVKSGVVSPIGYGWYDKLPSETLANNTQGSGRPPRDKWSKRFRDALAVTRDIVARRTDGRAASVEPVEAFCARLPSLGHAAYQVWWRQLVAEFTSLIPAQAPTAYIVLAAALAEGALVFVCATARDRGLLLVDEAVFQRGPKEWAFDQLIRGAKRSTDPMLSDALGRRAERLKLARQRIHAGRYLAQNVTPGQLDLRPEEARESRESLDSILRGILDWLDRTEAPAQ